MTGMKFKFPVAILLLVLVVAWVSYPSVARWEQTARRRAMMGVPQAERALRVPTQQRLAAAFPDGSLDILKQSHQLTLFSVKPRESFGQSKHTFHDYEILGQIALTETDAKLSLLSSLFDGLVAAPGDNMNNIAFGCFEPRHGIRAKHQGNTVDLLICFKCHRFRIYQSNKRDFISGFINSYPQPTFNQMLTAANIAISK